MKHHGRSNLHGSVPLGYIHAKIQQQSLNIMVQQESSNIIKMLTMVIWITDIERSTDLLKTHWIYLQYTLFRVKQPFPT